MSKKEKCKEIIGKLLGPASATLVDQMSEAEVVEKCRSKIKALLGEEKAKEFDNI